MFLKSGIIIPFRFKDTKKLVAVPSSKSEYEKITISDVKIAIYSAFENLGNKKCKFYNPKIDFEIPEELFIPYLEQSKALTNFVVDIVETDEIREVKIEVEEITVVETDEIYQVKVEVEEINVVQQNRLPPPQQQKSIEIKKPCKRNAGKAHPHLTKRQKLNFFDQHLENILKSSDEGRAIVSNYEVANQLSEENRLALINLIINFEFESLLESDAPIAIDRTRLEDLSSAIVRKFPSEIISTYFVAYSNYVKYLAGGKLYEYFQNKKVQYMQMESSDRYYNKPEGTFEADFPELKDLDWCDWDTHCEVWKNTFELRMVYLRSILDPLSYFEKVISVLYDNSIDLLDSDFEKLYPEKKFILFKNWGPFYDRILNEVLVLGWKDVQLIVDLYAKMPELSSFMMLSYFIQNYERVLKPFKKDDPGNLIIHVDKIDGQTHHKFLRDYCEIHNLQTPVILVTGTTQNDEGCFVLVGSSLLPMGNALACAVDFCFKCFQVFQWAYPAKQRLIWQVIQNVFYDIYTDKDCEVSANLLRILKN